MSGAVGDAMGGVQARVAQLAATMAGLAAGDLSTVPSTGASFAAALAASALTGAVVPVSAGASSAIQGTPASTSASPTTVGVVNTGSAVAALPWSSATQMTGAGFLAAASKYTGTPYKWGGANVATDGGLDCSGLVLATLRDIGAADGVPRVAADQQHMSKGQVIASLADARPGDLLFFHDPATHVGIYAGNGKMLDAPHAGSSVGLHDVWPSGPSTIRRLFAPTSATAAVSAADQQLATAAVTAAQQAALGLDAASSVSSSIS